VFDPSHATRRRQYSLKSISFNTKLCSDAAKAAVNRA
jgi:hypothetical protein